MFEGSSQAVHRACESIQVYSTYMVETGKTGGPESAQVANNNLWRRDA